MSNYTPDKWVMVKITSKKHGTTYKVLASWYGGFGGSDSWKLSSGTLRAKPFARKEGWIDFPQESGSTYICHPDLYGMSHYTSGVYREFEKQLEEVKDGSTIEVLPETTDFYSMEYT